MAVSQERTYEEALRLCETVRSRILASSGRRLLDVPPKEIHHFQNLLHVCGSIRCLPKHQLLVEGITDFVTSLEILLRTASATATKSFSFRTLFLAEHICALLSTSSVSEGMERFSANLGFGDMTSFKTNGRLLEFVDVGGDDLWQLIVDEGFGLLQAVFISPEQALKTLPTIFSGSFGVFPSLCAWSDSSNGLERPEDSIVRKVCEMASNTLLSMAKALHDANSPTIVLPGFRDPVHLSPSFTLLIYYLSFSICPTPSSCNNLGILLSTTPWAEERGSQAISLARLFYEKGLELDANHAHILTNYGSLKKQAGDLDGAIE